MDNVETLARWIHEAFERTRAAAWKAVGRDLTTWDDLEEIRRDDYRAVARELLEHPPAVLCVPGVVVRGTR
jgi:hypothetical protein